jgi:c-di-GMP-binding flagellar brake protein YcgR
MTEPMPEISSSVSLTVGEAEHESRIELIEGKSVVVAAPLHETVETVEVAEIGATVALSWSAGPRGRYVVDTKLVSTSRVEGVPTRCWTLTIESEPVLHQRRRFVRAGGGEAVRVRATGRDVMLSGAASDISEGGVRFRISGVKPGDDEWVRLNDGEAITAVVQLGDDMLDADGSVLRTIDDHLAKTVDMIVTLDLSERQAEMVRRYVMRQQILARRAAADAEY